MTNAVPGAGEIGELRKKLKIPGFVIKIVSIAVLVILAYLLWNHFHEPSVEPSRQAAPQEIEKINKQQTSGYLSSKDYVSYQSDRQTLATEYMTNQKYADAERVMNDVLKNVPANKINSSSYSVLYQIEKAKNNISLEKKYLGLMVSSLRSEGKNSTADAAQAALDGLK